MLCIRTMFVPIPLPVISKTSKYCDVLVVKKLKKDCASEIFNLSPALTVFLSTLTLFCLHFFVYSKKTVQLIESKKDLACELVASWSVQVGDLDQCLHLWRYTGGFEKVDLAERDLKKDPVSFFHLLLFNSHDNFSVFLGLR